MEPYGYKYSTPYRILTHTPYFYSYSYIKVGVIAAFVVSGLMHELIYYYLTRVPYMGGDMVFHLTRSCSGHGSGGEEGGAG